MKSDALPRSRLLTLTRRGDIICNVNDVAGWAKGKTVCAGTTSAGGTFGYATAERAAHRWEAGVSMMNRTNKCTPTEYAISHCPLVFDVYEVMLWSTGAFREHNSNLEKGAMRTIHEPTTLLAGRLCPQSDVMSQESQSQHQ